jgi:hypothetical protein
MRSKSRAAWETAARCATLAQEADDPQEREHYARLRDAWITLAKRCEPFNLPDVTIPTNFERTSRLTRCPAGRTSPETRPRQEDRLPYLKCRASKGPALYYRHGIQAAHESGLQGDRATCDARLTPEKTLNFGTAPAQPRLNFESQEKCSATKEQGREEMANRRHERTTSQAARENAEDLIQSAKPLRQPPP